MISIGHGVYKSNYELYTDSFQDRHILTKEGNNQCSIHITKPWSQYFGISTCCLLIGYATTSSRIAGYVLLSVIPRLDQRDFSSTIFFRIL